MKFTLKVALAILVGAVTSAAVLALFAPLGSNWTLEGAALSFAIFLPFTLIAAVVFALSLVLLAIWFRKLGWITAITIGFWVGEAAAFFYCMHSNFNPTWFVLMGISGVLSAVAAYAVLRREGLGGPIPIKAENRTKM